MSYILQVDFKMEGPFGHEMVKEFTDLARGINDEEGLIWKIWTEDSEARKQAAFICLKRRNPQVSTCQCTQLG